VAREGLYSSVGGSREASPLHRERDVAVQGKVWNLAPRPRQQLEAAGMEFAWISTSGRRAIAIGPSGLGFFVDDDAQIEDWSNVVDFDFPAKNQVAVASLADGRRVEFTFANSKDRDEFMSALPDEGRAGDHADSAVRLDAASVALGGVPRELDSGSLSTIWTLLWCGVIAQAFGGVAFVDDA
jgi:hypothetical protein